MSESTEDSIETRLRIIETRLGRIESDIESEKGTRARVNESVTVKLEKLSDHMSRQDKIIFTGMGVLACLQFVAPLLFRAIYK